MLPPLPLDVVGSVVRGIGHSGSGNGTGVVQVDRPISPRDTPEPPPGTGTHWPWKPCTQPSPATSCSAASSSACDSRCFQAFSREVFAAGALDEKHKQLIAVTVAYVTQRPFCIRGHTNAAMRKGATESELMERSGWRPRCAPAASVHTRCWPSTSPRFTAASAAHQDLLLHDREIAPPGDVTRVERRYPPRALVLKIAFETRESAVKIILGPRRTEPARRTRWS